MGGGEDGEQLLNGHGVSVCSDEEASETGGGDGTMTLDGYEGHDTVHLHTPYILPQ